MCRMLETLDRVNKHFSHVLIASVFVCFENSLSPKQSSVVVYFFLITGRLNFLSELFLDHYNVSVVQSYVPSLVILISNSQDKMSQRVIK